MNELREKVLQWASDRMLLSADNAPKQTLKLAEEVGELCSAILKDDREAKIDAIGDILVVVFILADQLGLDPEACLQSAYNEIKDRKGVTHNGTFIKN